ncbi:CaiB/BaiF CoA transferase family protein [Enterovirga rhinocerotis]|uniref:Crotonobetainyl-CoA:carnitine CoA-transferase CaiB-like acyl-CoA transferase n=1 Tax=Enterovirga rhinocerotis TaxID=1339210 RepID=A0A4V3DYM3_9HYPH|nr:CoA transferase [Enterovirga rhinocerotis]TDR93229.1 crotonobetainyl-CoA:carnitine CoA-transferase CaiB-like acyl-CoA transferase [Enterovirga rhinocerotis]
MSEGPSGQPPRDASPSAPLAGIRVLDIATFIAAPFCGTILGDFGAEVIKVEQPVVGDPLRRFGTPTECGDSLVWLSESRNKKSVTLDLRTPRGADLFRALVAQSDVVVENFRPGTLEKWGIGFEDLRAINPRLVMLRISAYGQTGPMKDEPGFARIAHAFSGLSTLAGEADGPPVVPGSTSMADYCSGMWGAIGILLALRVRERTGRGQFIDLGLYESVFRLLDEIAPAYARHGYVRERMGADTVNVCPHSHYETATGSWIAIACTSDKMWARLAEVMGRPELATSPHYVTTAARLERRSEVNGIVADWVRTLTKEQVLAACSAGGVPCGPLNTIADIFEDPHFKARGNMVEFDDPRIGKVVLPAAVPRLSETPAELRFTGRPMGADNEDILGGLLGVSSEEIAAIARPAKGSAI